MSKFTWISALATCSFAIAAVGFGAAGSAQASGTALTLTLTGGSLEISAPATADLGSAVTSSAGTVVAVVVLSGALFRSLRARRRRRSL